MAIGEMLLQGISASGRPIPVKVENDGRLSVNQSAGEGAGTGVDPVAIKDGTDPTRKLVVDAQGRVTVLGPLTDAQLRATALLVSLSGAADVADRAARLLGHVTVDNPSLPVTGTFWPGTQPVSGAVSADTELPAAAVLSDTDPNPTAPTVGAAGLVWSGAAWVRARGGTGDGAGATGMQNVLPMLFNGTSHDRLRGDTANGLDVDVTRVAGTVAVSIATAPVTPVTDNGGTLSVDDGAGSLTVDGTVAISSLPALVAGNANIGDVDVLTLPALPAGNNNIGDVDVVTLPALTALSAPGNSPHAVASLGNSLGKTNVLKTGNLVTTAVTADQVILTYTVTAGKTFYLQNFSIMARLTTFAATATFFGAASLESPAGTKLFTMDIAGTGVSAPLVIPFDEPVPITSGTVIRMVCTPSAVTSMTWKANFGGYEK